MWPLIGQKPYMTDIWLTDTFPQCLAKTPVSIYEYIETGFLSKQPLASQYNVNKGGDSVIPALHMRSLALPKKKKKNTPYIGANLAKIITYIGANIIIIHV